MSAVRYRCCPHCSSEAFLPESLMPMPPGYCSDNMEPRDHHGIPCPVRGCQGDQLDAATVRP